jgi:molybdopterin molybdotransferase
MIEVYEAIQILADAVSRLPAEQVPLAEARGRVLAAPVAADRDFPPTDRSSMDGFAVRAADLVTAPATLTVVGEVAAGSSAHDVSVGAGQAARIFTGGVLPPGADTVVMVERTREDRGAGTVRIEISPPAGEHVRRRGEEMRAGRAVLEPGTVIHAPELAALAAVGCTTVSVTRRPVVHVLATGDELVDPAQVPGEHQVRNSNSITLLAQLAELGLPAIGLGVAPDRTDELDALLQRGLAGDVLLVTGGVSVGQYDLVGRTLADAGMELLFHKVRVKPGKPVLAGRRGDCLVLGLPGNPVSAFTGFALFAAPTLRRMLGYRKWANQPVTAVLEEPFRQSTGRTNYHLACLEARDGKIVARGTGSTGSGDLLSMTRANGFVIGPDDESEIGAGRTLPALLWRDFQFRSL